MIRKVPASSGPWKLAKRVKNAILKFADLAGPWPTVQTVSHGHQNSHGTVASVLRSGGPWFTVQTVIHGQTWSTDFEKSYKIVEKSLEGVFYMPGKLMKLSTFHLWTWKAESKVKDVKMGREQLVCKNIIVNYSVYTLWHKS